MKKSNAMIAALFSAALLSGCKSGKNALEVNALNGEWNITSVKGESVTADKTPFLGLDFTKNSIYGCAGCNRIFGSVVADENKPGKLSFDKVATSRMMCNDMTAERNILAALNEVKGYEGTKEEITLTDNNGKAVINLQKRPENKIESLAGKWTIAEVNGEEIVLTQSDKMPFIEFNINESRVHGNGGCNTFNGSYLQEKDEKASLKFDKMMSTMMAGPGMEIESKVMPAVNNVRSFMFIDKNTVSLIDENGEEIITLKKQ